MSKASKALLSQIVEKPALPDSRNYVSVDNCWFSFSKTFPNFPILTPFGSHHDSFGRQFLDPVFTVCSPQDPQLLLVEAGLGVLLIHLGNHLPAAHLLWLLLHPPGRAAVAAATDTYSKANFTIKFFQLASY